MMRADKHARMMRAYEANGGFTGPRTVAAVQAGVPDELWDRLTGHDLGLVMAALTAAHRAGREAERAEAND